METVGLLGACFAVCVVLVGCSSKGDPLSSAEDTVDPIASAKEMVAEHSGANIIADSSNISVIAHELVEGTWEGLTGVIEVSFDRLGEDVKIEDIMAASVVAIGGNEALSPGNGTASAKSGGRIRMWGGRAGYTRDSVINFSGHSEIFFSNYSVDDSLFIGGNLTIRFSGTIFQERAGVAESNQFDIDVNGSLAFEGIFSGAVGLDLNVSAINDLGVGTGTATVGEQIYLVTVNDLELSSDDIENRDESTSGG